MPVPPEELDELIALMEVRYDLRTILSAVVLEQLTPLPDNERTRRACDRLIVHCVAHDNFAGGDQPRVYAASSGVLAGFYAVVDRPRLDELPVIPALINLYVPLRDDGADDRFLFALDWRALPWSPWRRGTVYLLPRELFTADHHNTRRSTQTPNCSGASRERSRVGSVFRSWLWAPTGF